MLTVHQVQASRRGDERTRGGRRQLWQRSDEARGNQSREDGSIGTPWHPTQQPLTTGRLQHESPSVP